MSEARFLKLVGEKGSEFRDKSHKPETHKVLYHEVNVLVGHGSLFIDEGLVLTYHHALKVCLEKLLRVGILVLDHSKGLRARHLPAGAMSQRIARVRAVFSDDFDHVGVRATRARYDEQLGVV